MLFQLRGGQGAPFCSTLQLSRYFKMLSWSYKGGFFGNYLCVGKMIASIAQGTSPCAQSARRQHPCCRRFPQNTLSTSVIVSPSAASLQALWSHLLVLPARLPLSEDSDASSTTNFPALCRRCRGDAMIFKTRGGSARSGQKKASKNLIQNQFIKTTHFENSLFLYISYISYKIYFNSFKNVQCKKN